MTPTQLNSAVQSVISATRVNTTEPAEGMHVLIAANYAFWKSYRAPNSNFEDWSKQILETLNELHRLNTMKGTA